INYNYLDLLKRYLIATCLPLKLRQGVSTPIGIVCDATQRLHGYLLVNTSRVCRWGKYSSTWSLEAAWVVVVPVIQHYTCGIWIDMTWNSDSFWSSYLTGRRNGNLCASKMTVSKVRKVQGVKQTQYSIGHHQL